VSVRRCIVAVLLVGATPAFAGDDTDAATRRLQACVSSGAAGAPRTSIGAAVVAVRTLCAPQIRTLRDIRVRNATSGLSGAEAADVARSTERALNDEIAAAVSRFTGLTS
jgi:hypothetical protein